MTLERRTVSKRLRERIKIGFKCVLSNSTRVPRYAPENLRDEFLDASLRSASAMHMRRMDGHHEAGAGARGARGGGGGGPDADSGNNNNNNNTFLVGFDIETASNALRDRYNITLVTGGGAGVGSGDEDEAGAIHPFTP